MINGVEIPPGVASTSTNGRSACHSALGHAERCDIVRRSKHLSRKGEIVSAATIVPTETWKCIYTTHACSVDGAILSGLATHPPQLGGRVYALSTPYSGPCGHRNACSSPSYHTSNCLTLDCVKICRRARKMPLPR